MNDGLECAKRQTDISMSPDIPPDRGTTSARLDYARHGL
jgi:hypothetical protein